MQKLILASASPQRKYLLEALGVEFTVIPSTFDESGFPEQDSARRAVQLAEEKAKDIASQYDDAFVIGCDTLVVSATGELLEKAPNADAAREMVAKLSGGTAIVHSGLCVIAPDGAAVTDLSSSSVTFKKLSEAELDWWIATGLWEGRSGSFQIDGKGQLMIERIEGDWSSIVGLPVFLLGKLLRKAGYNQLLELED